MEGSGKCGWGSREERRERIETLDREGRTGSVGWGRGLQLAVPVRSRWRRHRKCGVLAVAACSRSYRVASHRSLPRGHFSSRARRVSIVLPAPDDDCHFVQIGRFCLDLCPSRPRRYVRCLAYNDIVTCPHVLARTSIFPYACTRAFKPLDPALFSAILLDHRDRRSVAVLAQRRTHAQPRNALSVRVTYHAKSDCAAALVDSCTLVAWVNPSRLRRIRSIHSSTQSCSSGQLPCGIRIRHLGPL